MRSLPVLTFVAQLALPPSNLQQHEGYLWHHMLRLPPQSASRAALEGPHTILPNFLSPVRIVAQAPMLRTAMATLAEWTDTLLSSVVLQTSAYRWCLDIVITLEVYIGRRQRVR